MSVMRIRKAIVITTPIGRGLTEDDPCRWVETILDAETLEQIAFVDKWAEEERARLLSGRESSNESSNGVSK